MRDENEFGAVFKSRKKQKKVKAFVPAVEAKIQIQPVTAEPAPELSELDNFYEMPGPASEPEKGEDYPAFISRICEEENLPFVSGRRFLAVAGVQPDLVCSDRMIALEIHDPRRTQSGIMARVKALHHYGFRVQLITADDLMRSDARERCIRIIRSLLR